MGEGRTISLRHYDELAPGDFGRRLDPADRYRFSGRSRMVAELDDARDLDAVGVELAGPLINPAPGHAETLASVFGRLPEGVRIPHARWLPTGPRTSPVAALLRRVDELEIEYQSTGSRARRHYRERYPHRSLKATMAWLGEHAIRPTLCVTVGIPGDDQFTLLETLRRVYSLRPSRVQLHPLLAPPGSHFDRNRSRYQLISEPDPPYRVASHTSANRLELKWMIRICRTSIAGYNKWSKLSRRATP